MIREGESEAEDALLKLVEHEPISAEELSLAEIEIGLKDTLFSKHDE